MLGDLDLKRVRDGMAGLDITLTLTFHPGEEASQFSAQLEEAAGEIEAAAGGVVVVKRGEGKGMPARPALSLAYRGHSNIHYLALPEGPETPPFLEALLGLPRGAAGFQDGWARRLSGLRRPARLYVFMATTCPHCAQVVRTANRISLVSPQVGTYVIDAQRFEGLAGRFAVKSVPTTILDEGLTTTGVVSADELVDQILSRDEKGFAERVFHSLVDAGRFADAAGHMASEGAASFLKAWRRSTTSTRVGLMLVAEQSLEEDPAALTAIVPGLVDVLKAEDAALRGDTADLLGQIGDIRAATGLRDLLNDPNPDVAEIAGEALDGMMKEP